MFVFPTLIWGLFLVLLIKCLHGSSKPQMSLTQCHLLALLGGLVLVLWLWCLNGSSKLQMSWPTSSGSWGLVLSSSRDFDLSTSWDFVLNKCWFLLVPIQACLHSGWLWNFDYVGDYFSSFHQICLPNWGLCLMDIFCLLRFPHWKSLPFQGLCL